MHFQLYISIVRTDSPPRLIIYFSFRSCHLACAFNTLPLMGTGAFATCPLAGTCARAGTCLHSRTHSTQDQLSSARCVTGDVSSAAWSIGDAECSLGKTNQEKPGDAAVKGSEGEIPTQTETRVLKSARGHTVADQRQSSSVSMATAWQATKLLHCVVPWFMGRTHVTQG